MKPLRLLSVVFLFSLGSCALIQQGLVRAAVECPGELVASVTADLGSADWTARLEARAQAAGGQAVACALTKLLDSLAHPGRAEALVNMKEPSIINVVLRARAEAWLTAKGYPYGT